MSRDPYRVLGVPTDADDAAIKAAYLQAVRRNPPDRDARLFEAIRTAYEAIATERDRLHNRLFGIPDPEPWTLVEAWFDARATGRVDGDVLLAALAEGLERHR